MAPVSFGSGLSPRVSFVGWWPVWLGLCPSPFAPPRFSLAFFPLWLLRSFCVSAGFAGVSFLALQFAEFLFKFLCFVFLFCSAASISRCQRSKQFSI